MILRDIRREPGVTVLGLGGGLLMAGAGAGIMLMSVLSDRSDLVDVVIAAVLGIAIVAVPTAFLVMRTINGGPSVRLDSRGIVWGVGRPGRLSLDWTDVASVRVWMNPIRLGDTGVLLFTSSKAGTSTTLDRRVDRLLARIRRVDYGTPYVIATWSTDCSFRELCELVEARVPRDALPERRAS